MSTPDRETLEAYLARGLSSQGIADAIAAETGEHISASRVRVILAEEGLSTKHYDPESVIPESWRPIRKIHRGNWDLRRLRQIDYRRRGLPLSDDPAKAAVEERRLDAWIAELKAQNGVICYYPNTKKGFWPMRRQPGDGEFTSTRGEDPAEAESA